MSKVGKLKKKDADRARRNAGKANKDRSYNTRGGFQPTFEPNVICRCERPMPQRRKGEGVICCKCGKRRA